MLFNSVNFIVFFICVLVAYFSMPQRFRWVLILASSYYFYMCWKAEYIVLILASTIVDYLVAILLEKTDRAGRRKFLLSMSLLCNLGLLFFFKYANFFSASVEGTLERFNVFVDMPYYDFFLPVGISFYTFQTLSYTIDVYRRERSAERHFGYFASYVSFFPQLVAGPIERSSSLLGQFREEHKVSFEGFRKGGRLVLWGLFKKMVIADMISTVVNNIYAEPQMFSGSILLLGTFFFAVQIYCDFSGYSDIAIGVARILGFELMTNFKQPYLARSVSEFWSRWHISLSTWFRDYLYIPLGGNRVAKLRWLCNILTVFIVSGLWHGASWTFVIWGAIHGAYLVSAVLLGGIRQKIGDALIPKRFTPVVNLFKTAAVFCLVLIAWVFFRANSISEATYIIKQFANPGMIHTSDLWSLGLPRFEMMLSFMVIIILVMVDFVLANDKSRVRVLWDRPVFRRLCYCGMFYSIIFFGIFDKVEFIYFQF